MTKDDNDDDGDDNNVIIVEQTKKLRQYFVGANRTKQRHINKRTYNETFKWKLNHDDNNNNKKTILKNLRNTIVIRISMTITMSLINDL